MMGKEKKNGSPTELEGEMIARRPDDSYHFGGKNRTDSEG
jgi:hypothetical protein